MDVWGPFSISTSDGHRYFLTIVDDALRATWVFLLKAKSEFRSFIASFTLWFKPNLESKSNLLGLIMH